MKRTVFIPTRKSRVKDEFRDEFREGMRQRRQRLRLSFQVKRADPSIFEDDDGESIVSEMGQSEVSPFKRPFSLRPQAEFRPSRSQVEDFDVLPGHPSSERLEERFLGGEPGGKVLRAVFLF